ncbi:MAG: hypothetical protein QCI38_08280, partial [Candidatus Thermoplasmatota archaeon]|nr:hypothetical protein [Candidatus Thermoplasmatota archaeon]
HTWEGAEDNNIFRVMVFVNAAPFSVSLDPVVTVWDGTTKIIMGSVSPATGIDYLNVVVYQLNGMIYSTTPAQISANGRFSANVAVPTDVGEYRIVAEGAYRGESGYASQSFMFDVPPPVTEEEGMPLWMILVLIAMIIVPILAVSLYLYKYGLGVLVECGECGALIPVTSTKCPKCSVEFEKDTAKCSVCGSWVPIDSPTCGECGAEFTVAEMSPEEYKEKMEKQYKEFLEPYRVKASQELGVEPASLTDEQFAEWWPVQAEHISFEDWLALEEEKRSSIKPILCPECSSLNPAGASTCYKCGMSLDEVAENKKSEGFAAPEMPVTEVEVAEQPALSSVRTGPEQPSNTVEEEKKQPVVVTRPGSPPSQQVVTRKVVARPPPTTQQRVVVTKPDGQQPVVARKVVAKPPVVERKVVRPGEEKKEGESQ